ncbi:MAG: cell division protein, partial [Bacteroidaceae bacterium]|nr:cell division protein [Bacteroidaceae bacterium]
MAMFYLALKNRPISTDIDYKYLSDKTEGFLTSDISAIVNETARIAFRQKTVISMQMLKDVLKTRVPSLSKDAVKGYEQLREKFENQRKEKERKRIGFI